jgi:dGTPase
MRVLRDFLFENVYLNAEAKAEEPKASRVVRELFGYYMQHPETLPEDHRATCDEDLPTCVTDYVAGMTDRFAIRWFENFFLPKSWMV